MATVSVFGIGGTDHLNTGFEHVVGDFNAAQQFAWNGKDLRRNVRYQKKMMNFQDQLNRKNQVWSARMMPSLTVEGLRKANLNPLLAFSDFSGLSSSGAMGVSPSTVSGGDTEYSSANLGNSSFDPGGLQSALEFFGSGRQRRENIKTLESITSQELGTRGEISDINREMAPLVARAKSGKDLYDLHADSIASRNRAKREALTSYMLDRETDAVTGRARVHVNSDAPLASDAMNDFWNDFYREKQSGDKWRNSAYRQYLLDGNSVGNTLLDSVGTGIDLFTGGKSKGLKSPKFKIERKLKRKGKRRH